MYVIGTAGHVDHGKSTLVHALTGINPDRLQEEKDRGLTIDLGFAWLSLPNGEEVSIVDVPGHHKFIRNMLAGIGGIDLALLVVAADESVMPQTREHLAILNLLQVKTGLVALTKKDLITNDDWLEMVIADVKTLLKDTVLEGSPIVETSGTTGEGLNEIISTTESLLRNTPAKKDLGRPRLPIDRSFTMSGFGTVVTGTLIDGKLNVGQEIEIMPGAHPSRVRNLQTHGHKLDQAEPGNRVAANISGVSTKDIRRGQVLVAPGSTKTTTAFDIQLNILRDAPRAVRHNMFVTVHTGSAEVIGQLRLLNAPSVEPGGSTWAQLKLDTPIVVAKGDYFIIRSSQTTLGGGKIVDPHAKRHRRYHRLVLDRLALINNGTAREVLTNIIESNEPAEFQELINRANLESSSARSELAKMAKEKLIVSLPKGTIKSGTRIFTNLGWSSMTNKIGVFLDNWHTEFPIRKGAPKEELRSRVKMPHTIFNDILFRLQKDGVLESEGPVVRRPDHQRKLTLKQKKEVDNYLQRLASTPYSPPTDSPLNSEILTLLADEGKIVKVSETIIFTASAHSEMVEKTINQIKKNGEMTISDVRDLFVTSRKYALAFMDDLDRQRITRRVGDTRVLR